MASGLEADQEAIQRSRLLNADKRYTSDNLARTSSEVRVTDPNTGGEKGSKLARFSLIPSDFLWALAEHYGRGAAKYEDRNWERGYKWSLSLDALERHKAQWLLGEDDDPETGSSHLIAVAWHVIALWWWYKRGLGTNDIRPVVTEPVAPVVTRPSKVTCPIDGEVDCCSSVGICASAGKR